ncbi:hypothetical protein CLAIMM_11618 [Cladophialophora immunda]|nr:hypothetical protein CLAIMM_11618 [Cladophialophora immunda]
MEKPLKKRESRKIARKNSAMLQNHDFQASNVASGRLTLNPNAGPGFLAKAKSSADAGKTGLPDLTFSEMAFLKRKRQENGGRFPRIKEQDPRKKNCTSLHHEIAEFFSRPRGLRHEGSCLRNQPSTDSCVSWSGSPVPKRISLIHPRLSSVARSDKSESIHLHEAHGPTAPPVVRPTSSTSADFLEKFTTDALLHGVEEFSRGEKRRYSLTDLKKLAAQAASDLASDEGSGHDIDIVGNVIDSTNELQWPMLPISKGTLDSPHPTVPQQQRSLNQSAEYCNEPRREHPSVQPSGHNRVLLDAGSDKQDVDRISPSGSGPLRQLVSPTWHPQSLWEGFADMPMSSCHVHYSRNRHKDRELPLDADSIPELQRCAAGLGHSNRPAPAKPAVTGNFMNETEALHTIAESPCELDDFDRKLLQLGTGLALSESGAMVDRESPLYETDVEKPLQDAVGYWCEAFADSAADRYRAHDSLGVRHIRDVPVDNSQFQHGQEFARSYRHTSQDTTEGFSGFSRRHLLY